MCLYIANQLKIEIISVLFDKLRSTGLDLSQKAILLADKFAVTTVMVNRRFKELKLDENL